MRQRARPLAGLLFYENEVEDRLCLIRETGIVCVAPVPERFADTVGMRSRRRRATSTDTTAIITRRNVNKSNFIPQSPTELAARRCNPGRGDRL